MATILNHLTRKDSSPKLILLAPKKNEYAIKSFTSKNGIWDLVHYRGTTNHKECVFVVDLFLCSQRAKAVLAQLGTFRIIN